MTTTIYPAIAQAILPILPLFGVGGPSFTGERTSGDGIMWARTTANLSARTLYFIPSRLEAMQRTFPEVDVWKCPWLVFGVSGLDVQAGDVYTDGTLSYTITGQPVTHYGFLLGPASAVASTAAVVVVPPTGLAGSPMGLLLGLTYAA